MYCKIAALLTFSFLPFLSAAAPNGATNGGPTTVTTTSQCNTGVAQCCNSVQSAGSANPILAALGIVLKDLDVPVGLDCTPISVIGLGNGANCAQQPVCCQNTQFNGLVNIGCTPISL